MKVLILASDYPPARGGIQTWIYEIATRLPDAEVRVVAPAADGDTDVDRHSGVRTRRTAPRGRGLAVWIGALTAATLHECMRWRPDVIVCGHVAAAPAALAARAVFGLPYVVVVYAWEIRRRWRAFIGVCLRRAARVLAISHFTQQVALEHGVAPERVHVVHPGVDIDRFAGASVVGPPAGRSRRILGVSRLEEAYKGHDMVIRSLPLIEARCPEVEYVLVGDGSLRPYLSRLADSLGMGGRVGFVGEVSDEGLVALYRSADVVVQASRESSCDGGVEGFGIVCLEASAAGKPVVAGRSGGMPDAVEDGVSGLLVDPTDPGSIAEAVGRLLGDRSYAQRLGEQGRDRVRSAFTWGHAARRTRDLLGDVA